VSDFAASRSADSLDPSVSLESILCTGELGRRPLRSPDHEKENRALIALARALVDSKANILQILAEKILEVTQCDTSGLSLLQKDDGGKSFYWPAIAGMWQAYAGGGTPRDCAPCGDALDRNSAQLFHRFERRYLLFRPLVPQTEECLIVPFYLNGTAVGTMWAVAHSDRRKFDAEDVRMMTALGQFAALAYQTLDSMHDLQVQVAARQEAETALRRLATGVELRARSMIDNALDAVISMNAEGMITDWNHQAEKTFGWTRGEALGKRLSQTIIPEDYRAAHEMGLRRFLETGEGPVLNRRIELTAVRRNGQLFPVELTVNALKVGESWSFHAFVRDITTLKRAEEALRASEQTLAQIINSIPILAWSARPDGSVDFFNRHFQDYSGLSVGEAQGWGWAAIVHPDDQADLATYWQSVTLTGTPGEYEARFRRADGLYRWFLIRAQPLRDQSGEIVKWYGTNTDIEDRKRAEEALRDREQSLRLMFESIPALVCRLKADWEVEHANHELLDYFGKTLEELKDWAFVGVVHPDDLERVIARCRHSTETGEPYDIEHRCRRHDGAFRWFQVCGRPHRNASGQIVQWYIVLIDIEDRKRAEAAVRDSERTLRSIIDTIPTIAWSTEPDGSVEFVNRRWLEFTGLSSEQAHGFGWSAAIHPDDAPGLLKYWQASLESGAQVDVEARMRRFDGAYRWFLFRAGPLRDASGVVVKWYGINIDIEDRKQADEALRTAQARLARARQVATVGELSASIAHEVNQPLAAVVASGHACLRFLSAEPPNVDGAREAAESIIRDGKDAGEVVRRVRALFKRADVEKSMVNVNDVVVEVLGLLAVEIAKRGVSVETDLWDDAPLVCADRVQLQQLILNLLLNGMEAMDSVRNRPKQLTIRSKPESDGQVRIELKDNGVGLNDPDKIFEAFFTTKENGMGMGLSICRSIVEAHHGKLWVSPQEGPGATFCFTLPVTASVEC